MRLLGRLTTLVALIAALATSGAARTSASIRATEGLTPWAWQSQVGRVDDMIVSADQSTLIVWASVGGRRLWAMSADGTRPRQVGTFKDDPAVIGITGNGRYVLRQTGLNAREVDLRTGRSKLLRVRIPAPDKSGVPQSVWNIPSAIEEDGSVLELSPDGKPSHPPLRMLFDGKVHRIAATPAHLDPTGYFPAQPQNTAGTVGWCGRLSDGSVGVGYLQPGSQVISVHSTHIPMKDVSCGYIFGTRTLLLPTSGIALYAPGHGVHRWSATANTSGGTFFSPDGRYFVEYDLEGGACGDGTPKLSQRRIEIYDAHTGNHRRVNITGVSALSAICTPPIFSADSRFVAVGTNANSRPDSVQLVNLGTGSVRRVKPATDASGALYPVAFTPADRLIVCTSDLSRSNVDWWSVPASGTPLTQLTGGSFQPGHCSVASSSTSYHSGVWFSKSLAWLSDVDGRLYTAPAATFGQDTLG